MKTAVLLVGVLIVGAAVLWLLRARSTPSDSTGDVNVVMREAAEDAVRVAQAQHNLTLDFDAASVETVESILARIYDEQDGSPIPLDREKDEAWRWGAYIGEVILRTSPGGGRWEVDHPAAGSNSFPVVVDGGESFPIIWCRKRLRNGPEDNVWVKFETLYSSDAPRELFSANPEE